MLGRKTAFRLLSFFGFIILVVSMLTACGGGGGGSTGGTTGGGTGGTTGGGTGGSAAGVSGVASKGILQGATIKAYALDAAGVQGALLGTATTNALGAYSINLGTYTGNVLVVATAGTYVDESTGVTVANTATFRAAVTSVSGNISVAVTPFTEIAVQKAGTLTQANISQANTVVSNLLGGTNIITTMPADVLNTSSASASANSQNYGLALAAISQMVADGTAASVADAITQITADLAGNQLTTTGANLSAALTAFIASANNQTGVTGSTKAGAAIALYTASAIPSTPYSLADLPGTWHRREFGTQQNGKPDRYIYDAGTVVIQANGSTTDTPVACNNGCSVYSDTASIAADGILSFNPAAPDEYSYAAMNAGKDVIVSNYGNSLENHLVVNVKKAASYSSADLVGTWFGHGIGTTQNSFPSHFSYGVSSSVILANGTGTQTDIACTFVDCGPYSSTYTISADGTISDVNMATGEYAYAAMSAGKDVIVINHGYIGLPNQLPPENQFSVLVKKGGSYSTADLAGTWYMRQLGTQQNGKPDNFTYEAATVVIQPDGSTTETPVACNNGCSVYGTTVSIAADGTVSLAGLAPGEYYYGSMNAGKDVIVANGGDANENHIVILVKKADW